MTLRTTTLDNGFRIVTDAMDTVETVSLGVWIAAGTRDETHDINGVSHMLEHMAFKGTGRRSARDIAEQIEAVGGHLNAHTSREYTAYHASVLKEDVALAFDIVADILRDSRFDEAELARERAVILQEIGEARDTPDDVVFDQFQAAAFPDQPLGWPVLGDAKLVAGMPRDALISYMGAHYQAPAMVLAAAGRLDHDMLVEMAARAFGDLPAGSAPDRVPAAYRGGDTREERALEQLHILLGFSGVDYHDDDLYPVSILATALGGGMSSRLFQQVREERGLAYSVYAYHGAYSDGGLFGIYAGTGPAESKELIPVLCHELRDIAEAAGEDEIARARSQIKAGLLMSLESTYARCEQIARQMLIFGRPIPTDEIVARIEAVDVAAVRRAARRIAASPPTVAALGPIGALEDYEAIKARLVP